MCQKKWYGLPSSCLLQHLFRVCCLIGNSMVRQFDKKLFPQIFHSSMLSYLRLIMCQFHVGQIHQTEAEFQLKPCQRCHQLPLRLWKNSPPRELRSLQLNIIHNLYCICYIFTNVFRRVFQMYFSGLLAKHMRGAYIRPNFEMGTNLRNHSYCWRNFNNFSRQYIFAFMRPEEWGDLVCSTMCYISTSGNLYFGFIKQRKRCWVTKSSEKKTSRLFSLV